MVNMGHAENNRRVKFEVYTVAEESRYLLVQGVPAVSAHKELIQLFALYGAVDEYRVIDDYPHGEFEEVIWIRFQRIQSARIAKKKLDDYNFYGGTLHVCYAPEYESVQDTREKLQERRRAIAARIHKLKAEKESKKSGQASTSDQKERSQLSSTSISSSPVTTLPDPAAAHPAFEHGQPTAAPASTPHHVGFYGNRPEISQGNIPPAVSKQSHVQTSHSHPHFASSQTDSQRNTSQAYSPHAHPPPFSHPGNVLSQQYYREKMGSDLPGQIPATSTTDVKTSGVQVTSHGSSDQPADTVNTGPGEKIVNNLVVRAYKPKVKTKFIPRQVSRRSAVIKKTGVLEKEVLPPVPVDPVIEELKRNATTLGKLAGPSLPHEEEDKRQSFIASDTGDHSLDETSAAIREKVKQFSAKAIPIQIKRKKPDRGSKAPTKKHLKTS